MMTQLKDPSKPNEINEEIQKSLFGPTIPKSKPILTAIENTNPKSRYHKEKLTKLNVLYDLTSFTNNIL